MSHRAIELAELLDQSSPDEIEESETLRNSFQSYIARGNNNTRVHGLFTSWLQNQTRRAGENPIESSLNEEEATLTAYFVDQRAHGKGNGRRKRKVGDVKRCVAAVRKLRSAIELSPDVFKEFWFSNRKLAANEVMSSRHHRLMAWQNTLEESTVMNESARRLVLMYTHHEIDDLMDGSDRRPTGKGMESRLAAAIREFAQLSKMGKDDIVHARDEARPYMELVKLFGLGIVFMAGTEARDLWRKITNEELSWVKQYCESHEPKIIRTVQRLQHKAEEALLSGLNVYGASEEGFQSSTSLLSRCFKRDSRRDSGTGTDDAMNTLATAAAIEAANAGIDTRDANFGWTERATFNADLSTEASISARAAGPAEGQSDANAQLAPSWFQGGLDGVQLPTESSMDNEIVENSRMWLGQPGDWNLEWGDLLQGFVPGYRQEMSLPSGAVVP